MRTNASYYRFAGTLGIVLAAVGIMFISIWRQIEFQVERSLTGSNFEIKIQSASVSGLLMPEDSELHLDLPTQKYLPDHPFYYFKMISERVKLWLTFDDIEKVRLLDFYADERIGLARQLMLENKGQEAIEAAAKGYMYDLQSSDLLKKIDSPETAELWQHLSSAYSLHELVIRDLERAVPDSYKPKVDLIASGLNRLWLEAKENSLK